jgi:hypothetical protein
MLDEERVEALRERVRSRATEKRISLFEAAIELCHETWDNDEEELLQRWRLELAPRKHSRNPVKRMRTYLTQRHPWLMLILSVSIGVGLGATAGRPGLEPIFYPLAVIAALWLIGNYDIFLDMYYGLRSFPEYLNYRLRKLRPRFIEDALILGETPEMAERIADQHIAALRARMLDEERP